MAEEMVTISRTEYESLKQEIAQLTQVLSNLQERLRLTSKQRFGRSSEQSKYDDGSVQLGMELIFNEAELLSDDGLVVAEPDLTSVKEHKRKKHATNPEKLPEDVEIERVDLDLSEAEKACPQCGSVMQRIGEEVMRRLKIVPAKVVIVETHKATYACANCEKNDVSTPVKTAGSGVSTFLPGCMCTPEAVAYIMTQKFVMYSPLYRLEQEFNRMKVPLSRQTMSAWLTKATAAYLSPVYEVLKQQLLREDILHADETTLQVLHEPGRTPQQKSYMWLYRTGREARQQIVLYEYQETRKAEHPSRFLEDYTGYLHTDGYAGYHSLSDRITVVGCWAHARRKFGEAVNAISPNDRASSKAMKGKRYCDALFALESKLDALPAEERLSKRKESAELILSEFQQWLGAINPAPKSALGRAAAYTLEQWTWLTNYLLDGRLEISNNRAERSIKPFVMGRKNFLFANTPSGATTSAIIYSLIETARENGLEPYEYLSLLMHKASELDLSDTTQVERLLPGNLQ